MKRPASIILNVFSSSYFPPKKRRGNCHALRRDWYPFAEHETEAAPMQARFRESVRHMKITSFPQNESCDNAKSIMSVACCLCRLSATIHAAGTRCNAYGFRHEYRQTETGAQSKQISMSPRLFQQNAGRTPHPRHHCSEMAENTLDQRTETRDTGNQFAGRNGYGRRESWCRR